MQFDELHNKLFALAKQGTKDEHFASNAKMRGKGDRNKLNTKKASFLKDHGHNDHNSFQHLKNLQFTLFD